MFKKYVSMVVLVLLMPQVLADESKDVEDLVNLSKQKWNWMAEKKVDKLFHEKAKFVHMSGSWKKQTELDIIESGSIWYKKTSAHDAAVEMFNSSAILWNRITLEAVVRGNVVSNEFAVTEVYQKSDNGWQLLALTFSKARDTHKIEH